MLVPSLIPKKMRGSGSRGRTWGYAAADAGDGADAGDDAGDDEEDEDADDEAGDDDSDGDGSGCGGGDDGDDGDGDGGGEEEPTRGREQPRPSELNFRSPKSQAPVVKLGPIGQARRVLPGDVSATALAWAEFFKVSLLSNPGRQHGLDV